VPGFPFFASFYTHKHPATHCTDEEPPQRTAEREWRTPREGVDTAGLHSAQPLLSSQTATLGGPGTSLVLPIPLLTPHTLCQALRAGRSHKVWQLTLAVLPKPGTATRRPPASWPGCLPGWVQATFISLSPQAGLGLPGTHCARTQPFALNFHLHK
jgi:hypothetical protein